MPTSKRTTELKPYWQSPCGRATVYVGDCREVMAQMEPEQFHAVVTDPPYGLEFMGKQWDAPWKANGKVEVCDKGTDKSHPFRDGANRVEYGLSDPQGFQMWFNLCAAGMLRVVKPGAHLLSFGGTRMWHRMACAVEDAGWEIRDTVMWVYGSGFPKGVNVSKAIDKMLGAERGKTRTDGWTPTSNKFLQGLGTENHRPWKDKAKEVGYHEHDSDEPVTDTARQWQGYSTALKPAVEPIILARKPFKGTVAGCVMENGTGALNINGCRVGTKARQSSTGGMGRKANPIYGQFARTDVEAVETSQGRWPANLIHDGSDEVLDLFPQSKSSSQVMPLPLTPGDSIGEHHGNRSKSTLRGHDDSGSAARFFYTAKADSDDRPHGKGATTHPTVKPLDLMQYLVRLVCAPGGIVLDPFMGSGSTGCAAILEGMRFVGIEQSKEYADLAVGRLKLALAERGAQDVPTAPGRPTAQSAAPLPPTKLTGKS
jgi:DNA modification methylase